VVGIGPGRKRTKRGRGHHQNRWIFFFFFFFQAGVRGLGGRRISERVGNGRGYASKPAPQGLKGGGQSQTATEGRRPATFKGPALPRAAVPPIASSKGHAGSPPVGRGGRHSHNIAPKNIGNPAGDSEAGRSPRGSRGKRAAPSTPGLAPATRAPGVIICGEEYIRD